MSISYGSGRTLASCVETRELTRALHHVRFSARRGACSAAVFQVPSDDIMLMGARGATGSLPASSLGIEFQDGPSWMFRRQAVDVTGPSKTALGCLKGSWRLLGAFP